MTNQKIKEFSDSRGAQVLGWVFLHDNQAETGLSNLNAAKELSVTGDKNLLPECWGRKCFCPGLASR
jgi:hypothetical protein